MTDDSPRTAQVLVVNAGSSSLKLRVLGPSGEITAALDLDRWDGRPDHAELGRFLRGLSGVAAVGHRVVHGGSRFTGPAVIDDTVRSAITGLTGLAPLHQPRALAGMDAAAAALPGVPAVACFDTAFHAGMPAAAATYACRDRPPGARRAAHSSRARGIARYRCRTVAGARPGGRPQLAPP